MNVQFVRSIEGEVKLPPLKISVSDPMPHRRDPSKSRVSKPSLSMTDLEDVQYRRHMLRVLIARPPLAVLEPRITTLSEENRPSEVISCYNSTHQTNAPQTVFNLANGVIGSTIFAMPFIMGKCGYITLPIFSITSVLIAYCITCLTESLKTLQEENVAAYTFSDIAYFLWGSKGRIIVMILTSGTLTCVCVTFLLLSGLTLSSVFSFLPDAGWVVCCAVVISFLILFFPNMRKISYLSSMGLINSMICTVVVIIESISIHQQWRANLNELPFLVHPTRIFVAFSASSAVLGVLLQIPIIYAPVSNTSQWPKLVGLIYFVIFIIETIFILLSYAAYGQGTEDIVINNISSKWLRGIATLGVVVDKVISYPQVSQGAIFPITNFLRNHYKLDEKHSRKLSDLIAFILLIIASFIATQIKSFAAFAALLGAIFNTFTQFILPCFFRLVVCDNNPTHTIFCSIILLLSVVIFIGSMVNLIMYGFLL